MRCPFCKRELVRGEDRRYETIAEHGDNPNREDYPLRATYVCECEEEHDLFWDFDGAVYMTKHELDDIKRYYALKAKYGGHLDALDSVWTTIR
jgi:hypothetical protein